MSPGTLSWRHRRLTAQEASQVLGAPVPTLPLLLTPDTVEHVSVHRGVPTEPSGDRVDAGVVLLHLRVAYLPREQPWEQAAVWPAVQRGGSVLNAREQDPDPARRWPWPQRVAARHDAGTGDYTVVTVDGVAVGVRADRSGVVHLTWLAERGGRVLELSLLTRRGPRAAVELVADGGLLG